jgi:hypothetical protein
MLLLVRRFSELFKLYAAGIPFIERFCQIACNSNSILRFQRYFRLGLISYQLKVLSDDRSGRWSVRDAETTN